MNNNTIKWFATIIILCFVAVNISSSQTVTKGQYQEENPHETYMPSFRNDGKHCRVRNVILMIGDGMGLAHASAAMYANRGSLTFMNLKTMGLVRTQSSSDFTTDSAASGTALATGHKTHNRALGVDMNDQPLENIIETLSAWGYSTGILTTDYMDGATPGAFFAHQKDRGMSHAIWSDLAASPMNFAAAGCHDAFDALPDSIRFPIQNEFDVVFRIPEETDSKRIVYFPERGECASVNNPERKDFLPATTVFAMNYLRNLSRKGFFLLVEGARIDKSSHSNDFPAIVREVLDFDKAVEAALRFAEKDGHTLVIVTADHETGALTLRKGDMHEGMISGLLASSGHTPLPVPLYAYGPWSDLFMGVQENSDIPVKIKKILGR